MQTRWFILLIVLFIGFTLDMESVANQKKSLKAILEEKKDHRRVLLIYGRDDAQHYIIEQQESLNEVRDGLAERELDVMILVASLLPEPDRWYLMHSEFNLVPQENYMGWLIGKDGSIKQTYKKPVSTEDLFTTIDAMPMRQQEIKHE